MPILSQNEKMIGESVHAFAGRAGGIERARRLREPWPSFDHGAWREIVELGWIGMLVPEEAGGLGLDARSMIALTEEVGAALLPEPIVPAMVAALLLARCGTSAAPLLEGMLSGQSICLPMLGEPACSDGHGADTFLVTLVGGQSCLQVATRGAAGIRIIDEETVDGGSRTCLVTDRLDPAALPVLAAGPGLAAHLDEARDVVRLGYASLLAGLAGAALQLTTDYLKTRQQFGVPIGSFQAIQHRAASLYVALASSRALLYEAGSAFATGHRSFGAAAAKARCSEVAVKVVEECIQFHGAIGFTDDHDIGLFLRRAIAVAAAGGHPRACRETVVRLAAET